MKQEQTINKYDDEIDIKELFIILFKNKWLVLSFTVIAAIASVFYSLSLPNIYQSKTILVATQSSNNSSSAMQSYSGLANLAGISLPSSSSESNALQAIKKVNSLSFFENNVMPNIFLPDLMAVKSWSPKTNTLNLDKNIFDESKGIWTRKYTYPKKLIPSPQESFQTFKEHFSISHDMESGFVTLTVEHQSPHIAKQWANLVVDEINSFYREKDKSEAVKSINFLNQQITKTNLAEVKLVIASLLQQETQKLMLTEANEAYVYEYLDPPAVMERKSKPQRDVICIIGTFLGGLLASLIAFARHYFFRKI